MSFSWLALLTRSLRVESRMLRTHLFRMLVAAVILCGLAIAHSTGELLGAPGLNLFQQIVYLNFILITLLGLTFFAQAISEEKEEGTLGLLKMAGISPLALLLGKSTAQLVSRLLLFSVQLPFTMLAVTLGGVTRGQVLAAYCALLAYMILVANMALLPSVWFRRGANAAGFAGFLLAAFLLGAPITQFFYRDWLLQAGYVAKSGWIDSVVSPVLDAVVRANSYSRLDVILDSTFNQSAFSYQVGSNLIAGAAFFLLAWLTFERATREEKPTTPSRELAFRSTGRLKRWGVGRTWANGLIWKDFYFTAGGRAGLLTKGLLFLAVTGAVIWFIVLEQRPSYRRELLGGWMMGCGLVAAVVETSFASSRLFRDELHGKTLASLMMLPISTAQLVYSKAAGCMLGLIPAAVWFLAGAVIYPEGFAEAATEVVASPVTYYVVAHFAVFLHTTVLMSLYMKWGAWPMSFVLVYLMPSCLLSPLSMVLSGIGRFDEFVFFLLLTPICVAICVGLQLAIAARLRAVAAQ